MPRKSWSYRLQEHKAWMWKYFQNKYVATIDKNYKWRVSVIKFSIPPIFLYGFYKLANPLECVTMYHPAVKKLKQILMGHWSLKHNQPLLKTIFLKPSIISYTFGDNATRPQERHGASVPVCLYLYSHTSETKVTSLLHTGCVRNCTVPQEVENRQPINHFTTSNGEKICTFACILITSVRGPKSENGF